MEPTIQDTNVAPAEPAKNYVSDPNAIRAQLEAEIKAKREAATKPPVPVAPAATVATETPSKQEGTPPAAKAPEANKPDSLQQFRDKDGQVSLEKIEKSNEHLQKANDDKKARIDAALKLNRELMQKHTKTSQDLKTVEKEVAARFPDLTNGKLPPEVRQKIDSDMNKDYVETMVNLAAEIAEQKLNARLKPLEQDWQSFKGANRDTSLAQELDDIAQAGNQWVYAQDGKKLFDQAFQQRPWLLQSETPYKDALRFIDAPVAKQPDAAPSVRSTPILGAGHVLPPPSSTPTDTPEQQLKTLKAEFASALQMRDLKAAGEIQGKIKQLENRRLQYR